jgi:hypothetical protein
MISTTARALTRYPAEPMWKGPFGIYFRPVNRFGAMAMAYDTDVKTMKEAAKMPKAVGLPRGMAPSARMIMEHRRVAGTGQLRVSLTLENKW